MTSDFFFLIIPTISSVGWSVRNLFFFGLLGATNAVYSTLYGLVYLDFGRIFDCVVLAVDSRCGLAVGSEFRRWPWVPVVRPWLWPRIPVG